MLPNVFLAFIGPIIRHFKCLKLFNVVVQKHLGWKFDLIHGLVPGLVPPPGPHLHLHVPQKTSVQKLLYLFVIQIFTNKDKFLAPVSMRPFLE